MIGNEIEDKQQIYLSYLLWLAQCIVGATTTMHLERGAHLATSKPVALIQKHKSALKVALARGKTGSKTRLC